MGLWNHLVSDAVTLVLLVPVGLVEVPDDTGGEVAVVDEDVIDCVGFLFHSIDKLLQSANPSSESLSFMISPGS